MKKKETKVRIKIYYTTKKMELMSDIMSHLDLGIESVAPNPIVATYTTTSKVDKKYKEKLLKAYREGFAGDEVIIKDIELEIIKKVS